MSYVINFCIFAFFIFNLSIHQMPIILYDFSSYFTCKVQIFFLSLHLKPLQRIENEVKSRNIGPFETL